ncbi:MAG: metalloregulator ArsR/SmtB family transcription factor [Aeromicrobium erythreum]
MPDPRRELDVRYGAVADLFGALATPVRAAIVHALTQRAWGVGELAEELGISQPLASQHLRTLRTAGLVESVRQGRSVEYGLVDDHVAHVFLDALAHSDETS